MSETPQTNANAPLEPEGLTPLKDNGLLYSHGDKIIRFSGELGFGEMGSEKTRSVHESLKLAQELFTELESDYGIRTSGFKPVISQGNDGFAKAMIVSQRVEGRGFARGEVLPDDVAPAASRLFEKLSGYLHTKQEEEQPFLRDIFGIEQYVYDEAQEDFVLVDMDPYFAEGEGGVAEYAWSLHELSRWAASAVGADGVDDWRRHMIQGSYSEELAEMMSRIDDM